MLCETSASIERLNMYEKIDRLEETWPQALVHAVKIRAHGGLSGRLEVSEKD
jgi:hypothetical protein